MTREVQGSLFRIVRTLGCLKLADPMPPVIECCADRYVFRWISSRLRQSSHHTLVQLGITSLTPASAPPTFNLDLYEHNFFG